MKGELTSACTDRSTAISGPFAFPGTGRNNQHREISRKTEPEHYLHFLTPLTYLEGLTPGRPLPLCKASDRIIVPRGMLTTDSNENNVALPPVPAAPGSEKHGEACYSFSSHFPSSQHTFHLHWTSRGRRRRWRRRCKRKSTSSLTQRNPPVE